MALGENLDNLSKDVKEYIRKSIDGCKLRIVDKLSRLVGDFLCGCILSVLIFAIVLFLLSVAVVAVAPYIGLLPALLLAIIFLAMLAIIVYLCRTSLFTDRVVRRLVQFFFEDDEE